ncbi:MAG: helix-turn-helix transcriptional regulator [Bacteroidales bacterium]|nr:helix-turn-helix transcriptional regulator [Bacteroidales bacterium]
MEVAFDRYTIYDFSDEAIILELCGKVRNLRRSCCISQTELAQKSGVSIASIKRIEAGTITDLNVGTLIKILRACGNLEGMADLVPDVPESPFLIDQKTGKTRKYCPSSYKSFTSIE